MFDRFPTFQVLASLRNPSLRYPASGQKPQTAYAVSYALWPEELPTALRRFALAEARAHVEYLVHRHQAARSDRDGLVEYSAVG